jgi:NAD/NADP transhydrogenase beta subunit
VLGVLGVNGWHNVVHLLTGLAGLAVARSYSGSRAYAIGLGVVYTAVAIWGFVIGNGEAILGFLPVNSEDNVLHLLIALAGIGAGLGTAATPRPSERGVAEPESSLRELKI